MRSGTTSWYPNSGVSHHICRDVSTLRDVTPYSGKSSLLMGNGTLAVISSIGTAILPTQYKSLRLSNVLCVPSIQKNLLSVSQLARDNGVYFEFHPTYCVIKDMVTREILLTGSIHDGLYQFSVPVVSTPPTTAPFVAHSQVSHTVSNSSVFALWHNRLGHPSTSVVKTILNKCNVVSSKNSFDGICTACQKGRSHKLPFSPSTTSYSPFELVVSDL